ncbi:tail protein (tape measure) [Escherichia coli]|uniref:tail protein (tape measure) n=1 Tax=Escherichia coli TaxID=562 RepID=UPI0018583547|nr:tail protein (tape measure) [Escherichia coli]EFM4225760.1 tail protein (tape measure) [Escherichia coli]EFM4248482.1 tail protein (tape measure) [Escherichia coli]EGI3121333.1 tail protein (tape measure) [Escherichia coli]EGI3126630.1 tail protein (tape measure) [Escherichia coli]EGI3140240.1 tail protein (tape measure) [Escherichia coli]
MASEKNAGSIVYEISADVEPLLQGGKQAIDALDKLDAAAQQSGKGMDNLDQSTSQTGSAFTELAGYANSMDNQLRKLNTNVSGIARAMEEARSGTGGASSEFSRAESIIEALGNQLAVLDEAQENGARSAAVLAAQLRAGSKATDEEKQKIGELTGRLYDMKTGVETGAKGTGAWKNSMQQAGYQVQDFIVQVQGGQSALVAFAQQGSQLAGAFGPGGAVVGAIIALSSVIAGTFVASLGNGKSAVDALKDAIESTDKVITLSQNGVGALSDKYAALARVNIQVATLMRQQAELELQAALGKVSSEVQKASKDFIGFGDSLISSLGGGYASVKLFNDYLSTLSITTNDFSQAMKQAAASGQAGQTTMQSIMATVGALASKFDLTDQQAYEFAKQLSDIAKNPSDAKLNELIVTLQRVGDGQSSGAKTAREYAARLLEIASTSADASMRLKALREMTDSLTSSQDRALKQAQQELFITRQTGDEKLKAQAWRDAENQGIKAGTKAFRDYYNVRLQTYKQQEANSQAAKDNAKAARESATATKSAERADESIAQKLANLRAASDLTTESIERRRIEEAGLRAQQSLGSSATQQQMEEAKALGEANEKAAISIQKRKEASQGFKQIQGAVSPVAAVDSSFSTQMEQLNQYVALYPQKISEVEAVRAQIEDQYRQKRMAAMWEEWAQQNAATQAAAAAFDSLGSVASNALTGIVTGSMSASDAMRSIGMTVLNSVVNSFVQMGLEWVKSAIMGQTATTSAVAVSTAAQTAGIATTTAASTAAAATQTAAWTPAAMLASISTLGGAAAIGIGAVLGALAMGVAGKRKNGGPVSAGGMYQVGEGGMPEIYQASTGKQYMIPGDNGKVISNKDMQGGGGINVVLNVQNYNGSSIDAQASSDGNGGVTVDLIVADLNNGGPISNAITSNMNVKRTPRGQG